MIVAKAATSVDADCGSTGQSRPYAPSWIDSFTDRVSRLPGPSWSYYLGIGVVVFLAETIILWGEGVYPIGTVLPIHVFEAVIVAFLPALLHYLDRRASAALATLRPILKASEEEHHEVHYRLTTLPGWPTLLVSLTMLAFAVLTSCWFGLASGIAELAASPISYALSLAIYGLMWWSFGTLIYHTVFQLRQIHHVYTRYTHIDLCRTRPLYAFSSVTALTAVGLTIPPYAFLAVNRAQFDATAIGLVLPYTGLAIVAFVWPMLGIHLLLVEEKGRRLDEIALRLRAAAVDLHRRVDDGRFEGMDDLNNAMACLEIERGAVERIPTWPWQPETVRLLITALALPMGLWVVQLVLQRLLKP